MRRPEVRPPLPRRLFAKAFAPLSHPIAVTGEQNLRNLKAFERPRPRELRMLQEPVFETLLLSQNPGHKPNAGLDRHHRGGLAPGENRIANGDLLEPARLDDTLVHP